MPPLDAEVAPETATDDLRATLKAAMADPAAETSVAAPVAETPPAEATGVTTDVAQTIPAAAPAGDQPRAPDGKFAKPGEPAQESPPVQAATTPAAPEALPEGPIRPPATWSPAAKSAFLDASPVVQQEVLKREGDLETAMRNWQSKGERLNKIDAVIAPRRDKWALGGADEVTGIQRLIAAEDYLEKNPSDGIRYLAQQYGVNLADLARGPGYSGQPNGAPVYTAQPGQAQPVAQAQQPLQLATLPPELQGLLQKVATLEQSLTQQQQRDAEAKQSTFMAEVAAFAAQPGRTYFPDLAEDIILLLENNRAKDLPQAYDMAAHMRPDIRALILADESRAAQAKATTAQRAKASDAQRSAGSVTGSPGPGESAVSVGPAPSLREEIKRSMSNSTA